MKTMHGKKCFGLWKGMPYGEITDAFNDFRSYKNEIDKKAVVKHIEALNAFISSEPSFDLFTGEEFHSGVYEDGDFLFPVDFLRYYKNEDIGIPYEYEEYLKNILN